MDEKSRERMHQIAKSLKDLHLVANMEEAMERAKKIVESAEANGKPINELLSGMKEKASEQSKRAGHIENESEKSREEFSEEAHEHHAQAEKDLESAKESKETAKTAEEQLKYDVQVHKLEKGDTKEAVHEVDDIHCAVKDAEFIAKEAKKAQKKK
ncbi:Uncharacterised protein [uncultured archaeon]|nr:Uncharacterised protein [uncultured archaeon]